MKNKVLPIFSIFFFLIVFIIFYKGLQNSNIYTPKNNIEENIPSFTAQLFESSRKIKSEKIFKDDEIYLMNIWSSWCIPCREEHSILKELSNNKNLKIIGLNYKDNNENAKKFLKELGNPYEIIILDKNGTLAIEWGAYGVPETFLIKNKKIIKKIVGPLNNNFALEIKKIIQ